jgi:hypothetical protein
MSKEFVVDGSVQVIKPTLEGFMIHNVEFKGAEKPDFTGKDGTIYKTVTLKFENENGTFSATIFEPKDEDYTRKPSQFGGLNPCRVDIVLDQFKQIVEAVNPTYYKANIEGAAPRFKNWEELRTAFVELTKPGIGTQTKIKLEKNKKGEAQFPGFPLTISRDGALVRTSTYIGNNIAWTAKEIKAKTNYVGASVTPMASRPSLGMDLDSSAIAPKSSSADLNLSPIGMDDLN